MTLETTPVQLPSDHDLRQSSYLTGNEILSTAINIRASKHSLARLLYFYLLIIAASPLPLNVRATQSSSSAPVEVSWSPPTDGANGITGYRIYYGNGQSVFVSSVTVITSVSLKVDGNYIGQNVSVRSEADQLYSELVNVSIVNGKYTYYWAESDIIYSLWIQQCVLIVAQVKLVLLLE